MLRFGVVERLATPLALARGDTARFVMWKSIRRPHLGGGVTATVIKVAFQVVVVWWVAGRFFGGFAVPRLVTPPKMPRERNLGRRLRAFVDVVKSLRTGSRWGCAYRAGR